MSVDGEALLIPLPGGAMPPSPNTMCAASALIDTSGEVAGTESTNGTTGPVTSATPPGDGLGTRSGLQVWENRLEIPMSIWGGTSTGVVLGSSSRQLTCWPASLK